MAGPATDVLFDAAARRLRALASSIEQDTFCWPAADPAVYGDSMARSTTDETLRSTRDGVQRGVAQLRSDAAACDTYAQGCRAYYDAYRRYRAAQSAYDAAWTSYRNAVALMTDPSATAPLPPALAAPSEPTCPPYCDPSPVR